MARSSPQESPLPSVPTANEGAGDEPMPNDVCTTSEAARLLGVSNTTVQTMVERGELRAWKTLGGHRRISLAAIDQLRQERTGGTDRRGAGDTLTVLVVEDEETLRTVYAARIESWGLPIRLLTAADGMDALLLIERNRPDVLISDLMMAPMDGFELLRRLRERREYDRMSIVAVSSLDAAEVERRGGLPRGVALFGKPVPFDKLEGFVQALALRQQLDGR